MLKYNTFYTYNTCNTGVNTVKQNAMTSLTLCNLLHTGVSKCRTMWHC